MRSNSPHSARETRKAALPQVPTVTEAGLPGYEVRTWYGVYAPANLPRPILDRLSGEFAKVLNLPDVREKLLSQGLEPFISTPEQFVALMKADSSRYGKIVKDAGKWSDEDYRRGCFAGIIGEVTIQQIADWIQKLIPLVIKAVGGPMPGGGYVTCFTDITGPSKVDMP